MQNPILDAVNKLLKVTGLQIVGHNSATMDGLPLGVSVTGEVAVKTISAGISDNGSGNQLSPTYTIVTTSGSIPAGAKSVSMSTSSDFVGTVAGTDAPANTGLTWSAPFGTSLAAIPYTITAGSISITKLS